MSPVKGGMFGKILHTTLQESITWSTWPTWSPWNQSSRSEFYLDATWTSGLEGWNCNPKAPSSLPRLLDLLSVVPILTPRVTLVNRKPVYLFLLAILTPVGHNENYWFTNNCVTPIYKISKIASALWLAERCVCMRVRKHGCDVKMFCFCHSAAYNHKVDMTEIYDLPLSSGVVISALFDKPTLFNNISKTFINLMFFACLNSC